MTILCLLIVRLYLYGNSKERRFANLRACHWLFAFSKQGIILTKIPPSYEIALRMRVENKMLGLVGDVHKSP